MDELISRKDIENMNVGAHINPTNDKDASGKPVLSGSKDPWERIWMKTKFDDLYDRDERFFSILVKGILSWLNENIILYNKQIKHFILSTGSAYLYVESNGYYYSIKETTGEDWLYMTLPRCVIEPGGISIDTGSLSQPFARGEYERISSYYHGIKGYNAEIRRIPIEYSMSLHYVLSNYNEALVLTEEIINRILFQKYFYIIFLGHKIQCAVEFPTNFNISFNKPDLGANDANTRNIDIDLKVTCEYPCINERTEIASDRYISSMASGITLITGGENTFNTKFATGSNYGQDDYDNAKYVDPFVPKSEEEIEEKSDMAIDALDDLHNGENAYPEGHEGGSIYPHTGSGNNGDESGGGGSEGGGEGGGVTPDPDDPDSPINPHETIIDALINTNEEYLRGELGVYNISDGEYTWNPYGIRQRDLLSGIFSVVDATAVKTHYSNYYNKYIKRKK